MLVTKAADWLWGPAIGKSPWYADLELLAKDDGAALQRAHASRRAITQLLRHGANSKFVPSQNAAKWGATRVARQPKGPP